MSGHAPVRSAWSKALSADADAFDAKIAEGILQLTAGQRSPPDPCDWAQVPSCVVAEVGALTAHQVNQLGFIPGAQHPKLRALLLSRARSLRVSPHTHYLLSVAARLCGSQ